MQKEKNSVNNSEYNTRHYDPIYVNVLCAIKSGRVSRLIFCSCRIILN